MTEADTPGANALDVSEEVSSCEAAGRRGLAPVRGGFVRHSVCDQRAGMPVIKRKEGHLVDALALRGDEGRGTLRKARGRCERSAIPGCPNGATHPVTGILI